MLDSTVYIYVCVCVCVCVCVLTYNNNINKKIFIRFVYILPWKFGCDLRFHEILQTTIIRQITKKKKSKKKKGKVQRKTFGIV